MINQSDKFFDSMGYCNIIMLTFGALLCKIYIEGRIPLANVYGVIEQGIYKISGAFLFHMREGRIKLSELVCRK